MSQTADYRPDAIGYSEFMAARQSTDLGINNFVILRTLFNIYMDEDREELF